MKEDHYDHLDELIDTFIDICTTKYIKGQEEHGGKLWQKKGLLDEAINEAVDQVVYLLTLKQQLVERGWEE